MRSLIVGTGLALTLAGAAGAADGLDGRWVPPTGNVEIVFAPCGPAMCGSVARVMANRSMAGAGASAAAPAQIGMKIITALHPAGAGKWKGKLFDRERGKTYDCLVEPMGATMSVRPYVVLPVFGKTLTWTRTAS